MRPFKRNDLLPMSRNGQIRSGGEGGILSLPFLLSSCNAYTSTIVPCVYRSYKHIRSSATVSTVSPIRCSSAENGISGISGKVLLRGLESQNGFVLHSLCIALLDRRVSFPRGEGKEMIPERPRDRMVNKWKVVFIQGMELTRTTAQTSVESTQV